MRDASTRRICCLVVLLATTLLIALLRTSPEMRRRAASGLWLPYVLPANSRMRERLWDQIHKTANDSEGGPGNSLSASSCEMQPASLNPLKTPDDQGSFGF